MWPRTIILPCQDWPWL
uniref:Uncharacterized protein n=1 Tax=Anguilla anguilla TaxID=7936 RepID=A0A0E9PWT6_ANGAN